MWKERLKRSLQQYSPLIIFAAVCCVLAIVSEPFRSTYNLQQVGARTVTVGVIAIGQLLVILTGGIDLSVGSVAALSGIVGCLFMTGQLFAVFGDVIAAVGNAIAHQGSLFEPLGKAIAGIEPYIDHIDTWVMAMPPWFIVIFGVITGAFTGFACGMLNGVFTAKGKIPPFISTLGLMMAARGAARLLTDGQNVSGFPDLFAWLGGANGWWVPVGIVFAVTLLAAFMLTMTPFGRYLYAIGGNLEAARLSGLPVNAVRIAAFAISGTLAGFGGMILASRTGIGSVNAAEMLELDAIAACVLGGASLMGGQGSAIATLAGALIIAVLRNFCNLQQWDVNWQLVIVGGLVILLVYYDNLRKRKAGLLKES
jgi:ribose/xylose/arabinose/galactoside ABC-type transport system permease subunit